jgi:hypothetical protein
MLQGLQLSALPQVAPYPIQNPPRQRSRFQVRESPPPAPSLHVGVGEAFPVGTRVRVLRGCCQGLESTVTAIHPHLKHSIVLEPGKGRFPPDMLERVPLPAPDPVQPPSSRHQPKRRYSPKGKATGWIEERQGNKKRKTPSTSHYYCWQDATGKHKRYIKASQVTRVHQMVDQRRPTQEILDFLKPEAQ